MGQFGDIESESCLDVADCAVVFVYRTDLETGRKALQNILAAILCTFSVHNITVTRCVLLSEHTFTVRQSTICYVRSVCTKYVGHIFSSQSQTLKFMFSTNIKQQ